MSIVVPESLPKSRLEALLDHPRLIEDPREPWRVADPLDEVLCLLVSGTICGCDDHEGIASTGGPLGVFGAVGPLAGTISAARLKA